MVSEAIRKIVNWRKKETLIHLFVKKYLKGKLISKVEYYDTPLGEKIIIHCARPRFVLGKANERAQELAKILKTKFGLKNPQIEAIPVDNPLLDANIVAELIATRIERLGSRAARRVVARIIQQVMEAGARGVEIRLAGKIIGERATKIRFSAGNMKKSGEVNKEGVRKAIDIAILPQGVIGVQVRILPGDIRLPDEVKIKEPYEVRVEELEEIDPELAKKFQELLEEEGINKERRITQ